MFEHWFDSYDALEYCNHGAWMQYTNVVFSGQQPSWVPIGANHVAIDLKTGVVECLIDNEVIEARAIYTHAIKFK